MKGITTTAEKTQTNSQLQDLTKPQDDSYLDQQVEDFIVKKISTADEKDTTHQELLEQVAGLEIAKQTLLSSQRASIDRSTNNTVLLYGPPGCGKTYLANKFCSGSPKTVLYIQSSQLVLRDCNSSDVLLRKIFETARKHKPSIVFFDDIDQIAGEKDIYESNNERYLKIIYELFNQMSDVRYVDKDAITVIGATSLPWRIHTKIRRLFLSRTLVSLPTQEDRLKILNLSLKIPHKLTEEQKLLIATSTEGYSASDITILVRDACLQPVREITKATHFIEYLDANGKTKLTPYFGNEDPNAKQMKWTDIKEDMLEPRQIDYSDFQHSLLNIKQSISQQEIDQFSKFTEEFGSKE